MYEKQRDRRTENARLDSNGRDRVGRVCYLAGQVSCSHAVLQILPRDFVCQFSSPALSVLHLSRRRRFAFL